LYVHYKNEGPVEKSDLEGEEKSSKLKNTVQQAAGQLFLMEYVNFCRFDLQGQAHANRQ